MGVGSINQIYDDFVLMDDSGSTLNDFIGDCRINTVYPTSAGDTTQWTPISGSNFDNVNDSPANDAVYNSDHTAGNRDLYNVGDLGAVSILHVSTLYRLVNSDAGSRQVKTIAKVSGTVYDGPTVSPSTTVLYFTSDFTVNPATGLQWTYTEFNAAQFGVETV